jgi:hypothetical protein
MMEKRITGIDRMNEKHKTDNPAPNCTRVPDRSKYDVMVNGAKADVYDVLLAWDVRCPALQHLIKKALKVGDRGHKDITEDLDDIIASAIRSKELHGKSTGV